MNLLSVLFDNLDELTTLSIEHVQVSLISVALAALIAVPTAVFVHDKSRASAVVLAIGSGILTIPAFALFGILITVVGFGYKPTVLALTAYALLPILHNTIAGLNAVEPAALKAARGMGMTGLQRLVRVELPSAWPVLLTGLRISSVMTVSTAAIAAYVSGPGLGEPIFSGLQRIGGVNTVELTVVVIILIVFISLAIDTLLGLLGRFTISKGIRP